MALFFQIALVLFSFFSLYARADLRVFPTRIVLTDTKRVSNISLRHIGTQPARYKISLVFYRMKPDGSMELVPNAEKTTRPEEHSAVKLIRFSPRSVSLTPNNEQVVRILYSGPGNLANGEYRAHIYFEPLDEPEGDKITANDPSKKVSMHLQAKVAIAVPVIYKKGKTDFSANLSQLKVNKTPNKPQTFSVVLKSSGNAFPFGDLIATFLSPGKEPATVGIVRSVSSYLPERSFNYPLNPPEGVKVSGGILRLELKSPDEEGARVLATTETHVN